MTIEPEKLQNFDQLLSEFAATYPESPNGKRHVQLYSEARQTGQANYQAVLEAANRGEEITNLVLSKLLPHADTENNRANGSWIHIAPSITKNVKEWFEGAGWTKPEDWPKVAKAILDFISRCVESPSDLGVACAEFVQLPYSKGFQTGMLTPILNAIRPNNFLLINTKSRVVINDLADVDFSLGLIDYPDANHVGANLIDTFGVQLHKLKPSQMRAEDFFDMFCHWVVAIKKISLAGVSFWKISPGDGAWQWEACRKEGFIGMGYDDIGDVSKMSRNEFNTDRDLLLAENPQWTKGGVEQLWKFSRIRTGDRIVANLGTTEVLGIGTVVGPYYFVPEEKFGHRIPVKWDDTTPREVNEGGWRRTLIELDREKFEAIANLSTQSIDSEEINNEEVTTVANGETTWGGSLHQSFRLLPIERLSPNLRPFLEGNGLTKDEVLARLPYDRERSSSPGADGPDPKRYRDGKQIYQTAGLVYEDDGKLIVTDLGKTVGRWLEFITLKNRNILARHAAYALAACQLRNPTGSGKKYADSVSVFPFSYIWRAMIALGGRISSDELNRSLFKVKNEDDLHTSIRTIGEARNRRDPLIMGEETISGRGKNDRIIPWVSLASFGWTLFPDKRTGDGEAYYELDPKTLPIIKEAAQVRHRHRDFQTVAEYARYISACAALPKDLR